MWRRRRADVEKDPALKEPDPARGFLRWVAELFSWFLH
jgi:hypothetical protein